MIKYICDFCGKEFTENEYTSKVAKKINVEVNPHSEVEHSLMVNRYDATYKYLACDKCTSLFMLRFEHMISELEIECERGKK